MTLMTPEEEDQFRQAARRALTLSNDVALIGAGKENPPIPLFSVVAFAGQTGYLAIIVPEAWESEEHTECCHAILRQEGKALGGQQLD